jgi:hypothetical protein
MAQLPLINAQTGTTYTPVLTDAGKLITLSNAGAITLTVPPSSSVGYANGTSIDILQKGAGQVTVVGGSGVTVNASPSLKLRTQNSAATLIEIATDTWQLVGDLEATSPAFSVYSNASQSVSASTWTKILFQVEEFDTNSNFASSTFTPTVAGYYQINSVIYHSGSGGSILAVYKNGAAFKWGVQGQAGSYSMSSTQALVYCNGTTDYIDIYYFQDAGTATVSANSLYTFAQGFLARAA